jgi:signal transduction histidine kinase
MTGVTEQAQAALQLVLAMPDAVVVYGANGRVLLANAAAAAMLGLASEAAPTGMSAAEVARRLAGRGFYGPGEQEEQVRRAMELDPASSHRRLLCATDGRWFEVASLPLPAGGWAMVANDVTRHRQAEIAAWERLRLADAALRQNPSGIGIYDRDRRLMLHNDAYESLLTLPPGSLRVGMSFSEVTDVVLAAMAADAKGREGFEARRHLDRSQRQQFLHLRPNGVAVRAISQPLSEGGFLVVLEDVTPLHVAEEEAKRRADLLDAVLAALPHSVCVYGPDSRLRMVNAACRRIFKDDEVAVGDHLMDTLRRREDAGIFMDRRDPEEIFRRRFDFNRPPVVRMCADGTVLTGITAPLPDGGHISVISDITPLHRAEFEAQRRADFLQVMMDNMRHGICLFDKDCRVVAANSLARALTGLSEQEMAPGASLEDLRRIQLDRGQFGAGQAGVEVFNWRAQRVVPNFETYTRVTADGRSIEVSTDPTPDGGFVRIYSDVTAERQALAEIEHARTVAEEASSSKTRFLATMSHELRTPLNAVIGFSEALVDEVDPQNVKEFARTILEAGRHLLSLIDEVLAVAQAGAGALHMELRPLFMPSILESTLRLMRPAAEAAEVSLSLAPLPDLPRARADERRLRQILLNLIANALKFTPAGGSVTLGASLPQPDMLEITVSDTGIGIAADQLERAFEPFVQLETSHARRYGGSGLGLYLARALAQAMEATLVLDSERGNGTVARLRLKVARP